MPEVSEASEGSEGSGPGITSAHPTTMLSFGRPCLRGRHRPLLPSSPWQRAAPNTDAHGPSGCCWASTCSFIVACLGAAAGLGVFKVKLSNLSTVVIDSPEAAPVEVSEPRNILIIGTDSAGNLAEDDPVLNDRPPGEKLADVVMVLRIDPADGSARLLSFPRLVGGDRPRLGHGAHQQRDPPAPTGPRT